MHPVDCLSLEKEWMQNPISHPFVEAGSCV